MCYRVERVACAAAQFDGSQIYGRRAGALPAARHRAPGHKPVPLIRLKFYKTYKEFSPRGLTVIKNVASSARLPFSATRATRTAGHTNTINS